MQIEYVEISNLKEYKNNAREHPKKQIDLLVKNIKEFGFTTPLFIDEKNEIIAGHGRVLGAVRVGMHEVPCIRFKGLTQEQKNTLRIADNQIALLGKWDMGLLAYDFKLLPPELQELTGFNLKDLGLDESYTAKIKIPIYEPSAIKPELYELVDENKVEDILKKINEADLPSDIKRFLQIAATRHYTFNYARIADYYSHSDIKVKELFKDSVLVIIDINKAIEDGFLEYVNKIMDLQKEDD